MTIERYVCKPVYREVAPDLNMHPFPEPGHKICIISKHGGDWGAPETWVGGNVPGVDDDAFAGRESGSVKLPAVLNCHTIWVGALYKGHFKIHGNSLAGKTNIIVAEGGLHSVYELFFRNK